MCCDPRQAIGRLRDKCAAEAHPREFKWIGMLTCGLQGYISATGGRHEVGINNSFPLDLKARS